MLDIEKINRKLSSITIAGNEIDHRLNCIENDIYLNSFSAINDKFVKIKRRPKSHDFIALIKTIRKNENNTLLTRTSMNLDKNIDHNKNENSLLVRASLNPENKTQKKIDKDDCVSKSLCFPNEKSDDARNYFLKKRILKKLNYSPQKEYLFFHHISKKEVSFDAMEFTFMQQCK